VVVESFHYAQHFDITSAAQIARLASFMFSGALLLALPSVTALLLVNLAFGVLTRASPQLNIFSLGFPMTMLFGVLVVWVSSAGWMPQFDSLCSQFFVLLRASTS
jgi:flagellar biosynthetic protein FliR